MNKILVVTLFFSSFFMQTAAAEDNWRCITVDAQNKQWIVNSSYQITALNKSFDECKKESNVPATCKVIKESCNMFIKEASKRAKWQCTALDHNAVTWVATSSTNPDRAALSAKAYCRHNSAHPDSCYINLITCISLI
jgi:hypothetical protein